MRASGPALREHVKYCRDGRECRFPAPLAGISPSLRVIWGSRQEPVNSQTRKIAWPDEMPSDQRDEVSRSPPAELLSSEYSSRSGGTRCCEQPGPDFAKVPQPAPMHRRAANGRSTFRRRRSSPSARTLKNWLAVSARSEPAVRKPKAAEGNRSAKPASTPQLAPQCSPRWI